MNYSFKSKNQVPFPTKNTFLEVCEEHFDFFKVKSCCQSIVLYVCCVMGRFACSGSEVIFSPVALHHLLQLPITRMRAADGSRGSASGLPVSAFLTCCRLYLAGFCSFLVHENDLCTGAEWIHNSLPLAQSSFCFICIFLSL